MSARAFDYCDLLGGRVRFARIDDGFRPAIDSVLLAAALDAPPGARLLDLGVGAGAAALCALARIEGASAHGIDVDARALEAAAAGARASGLSGRLSLERRDLLAEEADPALRGAYDAVLTNPPYLETDAACPSPHPRRARAAALPPGGLSRWLAFAAAALASKGRFAMIHRADRLPEVLRALPGDLGAIEIAPLWPRADAKSAKRVIVRARKGSRSAASLSRGVVLHREDGAFAPAVEAVLRDGVPLAI